MTDKPEDTPAEENPPEAAEAAPVASKEKHGKKAKEVKSFDPLSDDPIKFKKIDFEHALTKEEKKAKKAEKAKAKKQAEKESKKAEKEAKKPKKSTSDLKKPKEDVAPKEDHSKEVVEEVIEVKKVAKEEAAPPKKKAKKKGSDEDATKEEKKEKKPKESKTEVAGEEGAAKEKKGKKGKKEKAEGGEKPEGKEKKGKKKGKGEEPPKEPEKPPGEEAAPTPTEEGVPVTEEAPPEEPPAEKTPKGKKGKKDKKSKSTESLGAEKKEKKPKKEKAAAKSTESLPGEKPEKKAKGGKKKKGASAVKLEETTEEGGEPVKKEKKAKKGKAKEPEKEGEEGAEKGKKKKGKRKDKEGEKAKKHFKDIQSASELLEARANQSKIFKSGSQTSESGSSSGGEGEEFEKVKKKEEKKEKKGKKGKKKGEPKAEGAEEKKPPAEKPPAEKAPAEEKPKKEKKGKGEKKEKKAKKKKEPVEEKPPAEEDPLAEIARLKAEADAKVKAEAEAKAKAEAEAKAKEAGEPSVASAGTEVVETPKKEKKKKEKGAAAKAPKGPKLTKKQKAKIAAQMEEARRIQAEMDAILDAEEEKEREKERQRFLAERDKRDQTEQTLREDFLATSTAFQKKIIQENLDLQKKAREEKNWELYLACDKLPNPAEVANMNTYLHLWENVIEKATIPETSSRAADALKLIGELDTLIDSSEIEDQSKLENWIWVRSLFRDEIQKNLDIASYRVLRDIERKMHRIDIPTADFHHKNDNFMMSLWLRIQLPTPLPNPRKPPKPRIELAYKDMKMQLILPLSIDCHKMAIRAMYLKYDHLSDTARSYNLPPISHNMYYTDLAESTKVEWREKNKYKFENYWKKKQEDLIQAEKELPLEERSEKKEMPTFGPTDEIPLVPYMKLSPTMSEHFISHEDSWYLSLKSVLSVSCADDEINLRKYSILGGVFYINLVHQPPQPQQLVSLEMTITNLYIPKALEQVPFYVSYNHPPPSISGSIRQPEEIEEEMKHFEEAMDKLIYVSLAIPDHVIFFELPSVVMWDPAKGYWSRNDIHDIKHNEEKGTVNFRTCRFGCFAMVTLKHLNFPFQTWEMRPEADGTINLQVTTALVVVEFSVKGGLVSLTQLQNSPNNALQDIVGHYFTLLDLIRKMRQGGLDLFPSMDSTFFVEGVQMKHWPMCEHNYYIMGQLALCFNFQWSRWNATLTRRQICMQMREFNPGKPKQKPFSMVLITPLRATYIKCTENSPQWNEEIEGDYKFYPNLWFLMKATSNMAIRKKAETIPLDMLYTISKLLLSLRLMSFS